MSVNPSSSRKKDVLSITPLALQNSDDVVLPADTRLQPAALVALLLDPVPGLTTASLIGLLVPPDAAELPIPVVAVVIDALRRA